MFYFCDQVLRNDPIQLFSRSDKDEREKRACGEFLPFWWVSPFVKELKNIETAKKWEMVINVS